jgi:phage host-nuclease inhibitor protein Gam
MFKKLFIKRIGLRVDDQIKAMNDEILNVEREYKARLIKPNKQLMNFKKRFQKEYPANKDETISNGKIEIDEKKLIEEKNEKIQEIKKKYRPNFDHIIIDCSPINYMDMMGIKTLIQVINFTVKYSLYSLFIFRFLKIIKKLVLLFYSAKFDVSFKLL